MVQNLVINPGLAIWVLEYSLHKLSPFIWQIDGVAIDGYHGFGDSNQRTFDGEVALISQEKTIQSLSICLAHFSHQGFQWLVQGYQYLPRPPFLISSSITNKIFEGEVIISENQDVIDWSEPNNYIYPVGTKNWFGILTVKDFQKVNLVAFSPYQNVTVLENDHLWSFEWDCSAGKIQTVPHLNLILVS